jgi:hypothetical protein
VRFELVDQGHPDELGVDPELGCDLIELFAGDPVGSVDLVVVKFDGALQDALSEGSTQGVEPVERIRCDRIGWLPATPIA